MKLFALAHPWALLAPMLLCLVFATGDRAASDYSPGFDLVYVSYRSIESEEQDLISATMFDGFPVWSPDGQQLIFARVFRVDEEPTTDLELMRVNADGSNLQRLTDNNLDERRVTWSPNGANLAFVGGFDLYVLPLTAAGAGSVIRLTDNGLGPDNLVWSPNGSQLAFNSSPVACVNTSDCPESELYVLSLPDGRLTRLTDNDHYDGNPTWSPDGAQLAYETGSLVTPALALLSPAGGAPTLLPTPGDAFNPAWSPDGALIAYSLTTSDDYRLAVIRPDGTVHRSLIAADDARLLDPMWTADSQSLLYHKLYTCWGCPTQGDFLSLINLITGDNRPINHFSTRSIPAITWSPTTNRVAFESLDAIVWMDIFAPLYDDWHHVTKRLQVNNDPTWSPDGRAIAFSSWIDYNRNIHAINTDRLHHRPLTTHPADDWNPAWSVDNRIAFSSNRDGNWDLFLMDANGNGQTNLTNSPAAEDDAAWSPDGRRLAFARRHDGNWDIYMMTVARPPATSAGNVIQLTTHPADDRNPTWSPDGLRLAFDSVRDGDSEIYVLTIGDPPGHETNLTQRNLSDEREPAWSSRNAIAYSGDNDLYVLNPDTGDSELWYEEVGFHAQPAWRMNYRIPRVWLPAVRG